MGGPRRSPGESVDALEEAIEVIRLMWSSERSVSFEGKHYRLEDARPGPPPAHPMGIWLGAFKPRMLRLVGRKADGWVPSLGVLSADELRAGHERIDAAAAEAGRDPRRIRRVLNLQGVIGESRTPPAGRLPVGYLMGEPLAGPPEWWAETLTRLRRGRLRHARVLARRPLAPPGRAPCGRGRAAAPDGHLDVRTGPYRGRVPRPAHDGHLGPRPVQGHPRAARARLGPLPRRDLRGRDRRDRDLDRRARRATRTCAAPTSSTSRTIPRSPSAAGSPSAPPRPPSRARSS